MTAQERLALLIEEAGKWEARFWRRVDKSGDCWLWTASTDSDGYGAFGARGFHVYVHRLSFALAHGRAPTGAVLHSCDVRHCVRPDHLREGTQLQNIADTVLRGRTPRGERSGRAKLTEEQVRTIILRCRGGDGYSELAPLYGVNPETIRGIALGRIWKHIARNP
jgi:hypothetical protein